MVLLIFVMGIWNLVLKTLFFYLQERPYDEVFEVLWDRKLGAGVNGPVVFVQGWNYVATFLA